jgi:very-short-patch-repair endonuclease
MQALWQAIRCLDEENALAAMESAIRRQFLSEAQVRRLGSIAPRRLQPAIRLLVANSGSGNESIVRFRLVRQGFRVAAQAHVPGLGHQDLLVEECLAIEVDSSEWHDDEDQRAIDTNRDLVSEGLGRRVLRIRPTHVHNSWESTLAVIERAVSDARRIRH